MYGNSSSPTILTAQAKNQIEQNRKVRQITDKEDENGPLNINQFLNSIRLESAKGESTRESQKKDVNSKEDREKYAQDIAQRAILEAEKFKATLEHPQGMSVDSLANLERLRFWDNDDDFFHIICHIEQQLVEKIQRGEFIELAKLLQKPDHLRGDDEGGKLNLINKDGEEYLIRTKNSAEKVNSIRKWDQAFRTYAAIYCQKHPTRAVEMLQYADVINQAALKFNWESVSKYDYVFRQLMAKKPFRSWAKTYTQGWTLILSGNDNASRQIGQVRNGQNLTGRSQKGDWRDNCCWNYNKRECRFGKNCRFEHRCTFCGAYGHPSQSCLKKNNAKRRHSDPPSSQNGHNQGQNSQGHGNGHGHGKSKNKKSPRQD